MSGFVYNFEQQFPTERQQNWGRFKGIPLIDAVIGQAHSTIAELEVFRALPARNQRLVLDMTSFAIEAVNDFNPVDDGFWGLYAIGSRARGEEHQYSDLDLLSVGTYYRSLRFASILGERAVFEGFELNEPDELPDEYNVGAVEGKYMVRAVPTTEDTIAVDLSVVDLTFRGGSDTTLDEFKATMDIFEDGSELPRVPLFELTKPGEPIEYRL